jgi:Na+/melibiose symporter-like transporter
VGVRTYALFSLACSFVNIPYGSLSAAMTQDPDDRARLSSSHAIAASVTILVIAAVVSPQLSGGGDLQRSLTITTIVFAVGAFAAAMAGAVAVAPGSTPAIGIACFGLLGLGLGMINTLIFAFQADTVDYGEWNSGVRAEGSSYALLSFTRKVGQGSAAPRRRTRSGSAATSPARRTRPTTR